MNSTFTTTDGCRLAYEAHGFDGSRGADDEKPAVVFLNGTTQTALMWRPQAVFLKNDFQVLCYDGRAQGKSDPGNRSLSLDLHVQDLSALLARLQIGRAHLVGLSHGAQVALAFAARHPEKAERLILCGIGDEPGSRARAIVRSWLEILDRSGLPAMAWAALPVILGESYLRANEMLLPKMVDALVTRNRKASLHAHLTALLAYPPPSDSAIRIAHRCQVISGSEDLLTAPAAAKQLARLTGGAWKQFQRAGHSLPVEAAERFNRLCRRFLAEPSAA